MLDKLYDLKDWFDEFYRDHHFEIVVDAIVVFLTSCLSWVLDKAHDLTIIGGLFLLLVRCAAALIWLWRSLKTKPGSPS